jgi:hypothetical protein
MESDFSISYYSAYWGNFDIGTINGYFSIAMAFLAQY